MPDAPTFTGLHFWVADMPATVAFYRLLGIPIPDGAEQGPFVNVDLSDGKSFAFGTHELTTRYDPGFKPSAAGPSHSCLQFNLSSRDAVDEMHARLTGAGHASHLAPFDAYWGSRYCEVLDPDGNVAGFQSPRDPERGGPVP